MSGDQFRAVVIDREGDTQRTTIRMVDEGQLPQGDVLIGIDASSINYKDGLLVTGAFLLIQSFPTVPGIDLTGTVERSTHPKWKAGDSVIANGLGLGERHWGGYADKCRLNGDWLIARPVQEIATCMNSAPSPRLSAASSTLQCKIEFLFWTLK